MRIHFLILSAERLCRPWWEPSECTLRTCGDMDRPEKTELEMDGKIYRDSEIGDIMLRRSRRCRRVSIRVHPVRGVVVTVPYYVPYEAGVMFLLSKRQWVLSVMARQKAVSVPPAGPDPAMTEALRREARRYLPERGIILRRVQASRSGECRRVQSHSPQLRPRSRMCSRIRQKAEQRIRKSLHL